MELIKISIIFLIVCIHSRPDQTLQYKILWDFGPEPVKILAYSENYSLVYSGDPNLPV